MSAHAAVNLVKQAHDKKPFTLEQYPRLKALREELLCAQKAVCARRARLLTDYFIREGFDKSRPIIRQASALKHILENIPPVIFDQELIVGSTTQHRLGMVVYPEFLSLAIWPELPTMSRRKKDPVTLSKQDADYLANVAFPFWKDLTIIEHVRKEGKDPEYLRLMERMVFFLLTKANGIGHLISDFETVVNRGLNSLIDEAAEKEKSAPDQEKADFYKAMQICFKAVIALADRYADQCEKQAGKANLKRARELREAAAALRNVPAKPAATLQEAIQSIWITQVALHQENSDMALSFGRIDQILGPFFDADLASRRIDRKRATELVGCFFLKMGDHHPLAPAASEAILGGASTGQVVTVGGMKPDGTDAVNELTYLMLDLSAVLALREPNMYARFHAHSSQRYRKAVVESLYINGAAPALYQDEPVIEALIFHGVKRKDARDYGIVGCVEPCPSGRSMSSTGSIPFNLAAVLELALNNGVFRISGKQIGPATGRLSDFISFDEFYAAFDKQLHFMVGMAVAGNNAFARAHATLHPSPLLSGVIRGTMESGRDVTCGGAMYNSSGVGIIGFADVADSLNAIRELVFEKGLVTPKELQAALAADFEGHEKTLALLRRKAGKYGTDDSRADQTAKNLTEWVVTNFDRYENPRGGRYHVGYWSLTMHTGFGAFIGALPNGRRKGVSLASGSTPVSGVARNGPTASLASTRKLPNKLLANGMANNHKFSRSLLAKPEKRLLLEKLIRGYFKQGGMQVQFNIHDKQTLLDAQADPEQYRDLLVRVSGYSAYFCDLSREMQNEIITRTEDNF